MAETIYLRGENGVVQAHDLPLPWGVATRLERGQIRRVNEDGSAWSPEPEAEHEPEQGVTVTAKPSTAAPKAQWVAWAVENGETPDDAEAKTKSELIEKFGSGE